MSRPTFRLLNKNHAQYGEPVPYTPILVTVGTVTHKLALHIDHNSQWRVSCPRSGALVLRVAGSYKGIRVSSEGYSLREIKAMAVQQVHAIVEQAGIEKFNRVLANSITVKEAA